MSYRKSVDKFREREQLRVLLPITTWRKSNPERLRGLRVGGHRIYRVFLQGSLHCPASHKENNSIHVLAISAR